jgi:hypothetical protein
MIYRIIVVLLIPPLAAVLLLGVWLGLHFRPFYVVRIKM